MKSCHRDIILITAVYIVNENVVGIKVPNEVRLTQTQKKCFV